MSHTESVAAAGRLRVGGFTVVSFQAVGPAETGRGMWRCQGAHVACFKLVLPAHTCYWQRWLFVQHNGEYGAIRHTEGAMLKYGSCLLCIVQLPVCVLLRKPPTICKVCRHRELLPLSVGNHCQLAGLDVQLVCQLPVVTVGYIRISTRGCWVNPYPVNACLEAAPSRLLPMVRKRS
jgi:hypothetical protein